MLDNWTEALETGGQIDTNYTDYEKAFDKVPHKKTCKEDCIFWIAPANSKVDGSFSQWETVPSQSKLKILELVSS